jgi:hypothetical protein
MEMTYNHLNTDEFRGTTRADYLIALDANFIVVVDGVTVYDEPSFPVVELARSLLIRLQHPGRDDFEFESMSFEEVGSIAFCQTAAGWTFRTVFDPSARTAPIGWAAVESSCRRLISKVEADLAALGLDPSKVLTW